MTCVNGKLRKLHRLINAAYMQLYKPYGLRGSMVSILFIIGKRRGINQKSIADLLILDQSTMSRDLKKLVTKGWVTTSRGDDSRQTILELTKEGCLLLEEITPLWSRMHEKVEHILGSYNIQNIDTITKALKANMDILKV